MEVDPRHKIFVPGRGNNNSRIVIVGEAPARNEIEQGKCFVGPSGRLLDDILLDAGIDENEVYKTNAVKYMLPSDVTPYGRKKGILQRCDEIEVKWEECIELLQNEIYKINPAIVIGLGNTALQALTGKKGITDYRGSILLGMGRKCICTYHPAGLLHKENEEFHKNWVRNIIDFDLKRALAQSEFPEFRLPQRLLSVCNSSSDLVSFIERHRNERDLSLDIEALACIPVCLGLAFTPHEGLSIPLWNKTDLCQISHIPNGDLTNIWLTLDQLLMDSRYHKIGQNLKYDLGKILPLGFKIDKLGTDTQLLAGAINPELPRSLAFNTSIYTEEPYYKNEWDEFDYHKHKIRDLLIYNARDACVTKEVKDGQIKDAEEFGVKDFYYEFQNELHDLYSEIESVGFRTDEIARKELLEKYMIREAKLKIRLHKLTGEVCNPNSWQQVSKLLYEVLHIPARKGTGEEVLTALLANVAKKPEQIEAINLILEARKVKKTIGTYILAKPDYDGRYRTSYFITGTETGRTSTQILKPPVRPKKCGFSWHTLTKHGEIGADIRIMYIPDPGLVFLQADQQGAEARIVSLLCKDYELLKQFDIIDCHALMASYIFGGTWKDHSKAKNNGKETPERFIGKTAKHASNYGATKKSLMLTVNTDAKKYNIPISISEWRASKILEIIHEKNPKIRQVFHKEIQELATGRVLRSPNGRTRIFYEKMGEELYREMYSQIPQSTVSDQTKLALLNLRKLRNSKQIPEIIICGESHDAGLFQIPKNELDDIVPIIKREMEKPIDFSRCSLPREIISIPCEIEVGNNYRDLSKYKVRELETI